jgi:hypothetical protein
MDYIIESLYNQIYIIFYSLKKNLNFYSLAPNFKDFSLIFLRFSYLSSFAPLSAMNPALISGRRLAALDRATVNLNMCVKCLVAALVSIQKDQVPDFCKFMDEADINLFGITHETIRQCNECTLRDCECFQVRSDRSTVS